MMRELVARVRDWFRRDKLDAELAEELAFHRERLVSEARAAGAEAEDAAHAAQRQLGNVTRIHEEARDRWALPWLDHLQLDVRYALRGLRRTPGFAAAVVITLGLGVGANTAMFNVIDRLMLRPYPHLRAPGEVQRVYLRVPGAQRLLTREAFPYARYLDLKKWTTSFSQYAAFFPTTVAVGTGAATSERSIAAVSASFFEFFDARPALGRFFVAAEDTTPAGANVAVLSFEFWRSSFGKRNVLGESIQIDNILCTIIGVAPPGFIGVADAVSPAVFLPITTFGGHQGGGSSVEYWLQYRWDWVEMLVRLRPGLTSTQADADLTQAYIKSREAARAIHSWMPRVDNVSPVAVAGAVKTAAGPYPGLEARTLVWVSGVAAIVLLIACGNVANLLLIRGLQRRQETSLRLALGVTRRRLMTQSMTESLVLALLGSAAGIALAQWGGLALRRLVLPSQEGMDLASDSRTLGVALVLAIAVGLVTGLLPLLISSRELSSSLKAGARAGTNQPSRLRSALLVSQGALSVLLLVGAGLFVRSVERVRQLRLGYDVSPVLMVHWKQRGERIGDAERLTVQRRLLQAASAIPGVERTAWASNVPLHGTSIMGLYVPGIDSVSRLGRFTYQTAGADYFAAIGTRILRGRSFTSDDRPGTATVAVVSEGMAAALWPGQDALGKCMRVGSDTAPCTTIVGIAEDAVHDPVSDQPLRYYLPVEQFPSEPASFLVLRMRGDAAPFAEEIRRTLQREMPGQQYVTVEPLTNLLTNQRRSWQLGATMFVAFGLLALVVAAVGLYGVIAYNVAQRMHELGVRIALGAQRRDVAWLVVGQGLRYALIGVAIGSALALGAASRVQPLLFQQSAKDPVVFGGVGAVLMAVALAASFFPAQKAMHADPNTVLRAE